MAKLVTHFKCLVISPGDVEEARDAVVSTILRWNAHAGEGLDVKVEAVRWESHARPQMGAAPQEIVNKQIADTCDFGIAVFWTRLGSPTASYPSGSVEEIERLLERGGNVMVYFCEAPIPQEALRDEQYDRLQELKHSYRERGLLASYSSVDEFRAILPLHLNGVVNALLIQQRAHGQPIPSQGTTTAPSPDIRVKVTAVALTPDGRMTAAISAEVQNHSPTDFFFSSFSFQLSNGKQIFFKRDFATGLPPLSRKIEPGNSFALMVDPEELSRELGDQTVTVVVVRDKIERQFSSREGDLPKALSGALKLAASLRRLPA
jgi:hypothetical protein